jgi:hypothetical protein
LGLWDFSFKYVKNRIVKLIAISVLLLCNNLLTISAIPGQDKPGPTQVREANGGGLKTQSLAKNFVTFGHPASNMRTE